MSDWSEVRKALLPLTVIPGLPLVSYPNPHDATGQIPPFRIRLTVTGISIAADLHDRFGSVVDLTVGNLPYPPRPVEERTFGDIPELAADIATFTTARNLRAHTGSELQFHLTIANHTADVLPVSGGSTLHARVVDPSSGRVVATYGRPAPAVSVTWTIPPGDSRDVPVVLVTDSCQMDVGYAVPPGQWATYVPFSVNDRRARENVRTPLLPLTIT